MTTIDDDLQGLDISREPAALRRKSRDYFWYSPLLNQSLEGHVADLVATPRSEDEVAQILRACFRHNVPCTVRGAGTGNYGQAVPLQGGIVLDMTAMQKIEWVRPYRVRCEAGVRLAALDEACRTAVGGELRLFPSTVKTATIGGFIAGGSTGIGGVRWGLLSSPGNIVAARILTMEENPRVIELQGADLRRVHHAYGTTGIITSVEMPLEPAISWDDRIVAFHDFATATQFAQSLCEEPGIRLRLCSLIASPTPQQYFGKLGATVPSGMHALLLTIAHDDLHVLDRHVAGCGDARYCEAAPGVLVDLKQPLHEFSWNHTTLQALKVDRTVTYLQILFSGPDHLKKIQWSYERFGDEAPMHLEFIRLGGEIRCFGLQLLRYTSSERLHAIMAEHSAHGCPVFDPHTVSLEGGGMKAVDYEQLSFKVETDPRGLLNPGKMDAWEQRDTLLPKTNAAGADKTKLIA